MENLNKELENLKEQRIENNLSLRKQKLNKEILKRRLGANNINYNIDIDKIIIREEFKKITFSNINDLLNFSSNILSNEKSDENDIKFIICLLKKTEIKNDKGEVSKSNIIKEISKVFIKYINDIKIVDQLLGILISFSYYLTVETNMNLLTNDYLNIYSKISSLYFNDSVIFYDLITLLGNLSNDNITAQNIFYQNKLFEEIFKLAKSDKAPKDKKDVSIFFLVNFTKGIQKNNNFKNNFELFQNLIDIMLLNFNKKQYLKYCLIALGNLSEITSLAEYLMKKKELFDFIFDLNTNDYYSEGNRILTNISYKGEDCNLYIIQNYGAIPYFIKSLNSSSNIIKGQTLFLLGNFIEDKPSKINEILENQGIFDKIFECLDSPFIDILNKAVYLLNILTGSLDNEGIFKLFQKNIHLKLINILKYDYKKEVIDKTIDAIIDFLEKDSQDGIIRQSFIDNGLKEVFSNMIFDRNDAEICFKTEELLKNYF